MIVMEFFGGPLDGQIYEQPETSVFFRDGQSERINDDLFELAEGEEFEYRVYCWESRTVHTYYSDLPYWQGIYDRMPMTHADARRIGKLRH